jgi:hypothetical protein
VTTSSSTATSSSSTARVPGARLSQPFELPGLVVVDDGVAREDVVLGLRAAIAASKLPGASQLDGGFAATRGFGVACHVDAVVDAVARVPWIGPFVDVALDPRLLSRLLRPTLLERVATTILGSVNALYLNVLVVPPGAGVGRHVDATLGVATAAPGDDRPLSPRAVVVLYVDVPEERQGAGLDGPAGGDLGGGQGSGQGSGPGGGPGGGALRLSAGDDVLAEIGPRAGRVVIFRGALGHEVTPVATTTTGTRVSCVAELYALPRRRLRRLPRVRVQSHGFAAVLQRLRRERAESSSSTG